MVLALTTLKDTVNLTTVMPLGFITVLPSAFEISKNCCIKYGSSYCKQIKKIHRQLDELDDPAQSKANNWKLATIFTSPALSLGLLSEKKSMEIA